MSNNSTNNNSSKKMPEPSTDKYGYDFYPSRAESYEKGVIQNEKKGWWKKINEGRQAPKTFNCAANVKSCVNNNYLIKVLVSALNKNGCPFNLDRHVSCEDCLPKVNGGYDPSNNQIVVCKNNSKDERSCCSVLTHELIHMFDHCRSKVDFKNLQHLACTEIRAASAIHCKFLTAMSQGEASPFDYTNKHKVCVRDKALMSVLMVRNINFKDAEEAVDKVFDRCYKDKEPFGRVPRGGTRDPEKIYEEARLYGYCD